MFNPKTEGGQLFQLELLLLRRIRGKQDKNEFFNHIISINGIMYCRLLFPRRYKKYISDGSKDIDCSDIELARLQKHTLPLDLLENVVYASNNGVYIAIF